MVTRKPIALLISEDELGALLCVAGSALGGDVIDLPPHVPSKEDRVATARAINNPQKQARAQGAFRFMQKPIFPNAADRGVAP